MLCASFRCVHRVHRGIPHPPAKSICPRVNRRRALGGGPVVAGEIDCRRSDGDSWLATTIGPFSAFGRLHHQCREPCSEDAIGEIACLSGGTIGCRQVTTGSGDDEPAYPLQLWQRSRAVNPFQDAVPCACVESGPELACRLASSRRRPPAEIVVGQRSQHTDATEPRLSRAIAPRLFAIVVGAP
jgi:hypothetical protein